ncbi:asparagine synthase-related protein [Pasteurella sp. PK-2025]|uniref:asparagine synthase-related protein n=1 Tax=unclassified Pasteurella TaxID=2621516 RepID=UPI003C746000
MKDITYCASSFLMYRDIVNKSKSFNDKPIFISPPQKKLINKIRNSEQLEQFLKNKIQSLTSDGKTALALSGGVDSAILAKYMPEGSTAYTFKCTVPNKVVADESVQASIYAKMYNLKHKIIEISWEDMEKYSTALMLNKNAPIHSIEVQIYKAALEAKNDGFTRIIFGEPADILFGGLDKLLSKDWTIGDFINRYCYVLPYKVLKDYVMELDPIINHCLPNGYIDVHNFLMESVHESDVIEYENPCSLAGLQFIGIYDEIELATTLDITRIRNGDPKYLITELFKKYYPNLSPPQKLPFPRAVNEWLKDWEGPKRKEFWPRCTDSMTGDQRWMVYILEKFLNLNESGDI